MSERNDSQGERPPREAPEKVAQAREFCQGLLDRMGAEVGVEVRETEESIGLALNAREGNRVELGGTVIEAIQYLVNRVVNPRAEGRKWVNIDLGGFADSDPVVKAMAERLAASARRMGKVLAIAPISARERRQIHLALVDVEGVSTRSEGEGIFRQLLIVPASQAAGD